MKRSTITLITILGFVLVVIFVTSYSVKGKFDRMDKKDLFQGFQRFHTDSFDYVKLEGGSDDANRIEILQGVSYDLSTVADSSFVQWKVSGDTLVVTSKRLYSTRNAFKPNPILYIVTPTLKGVIGLDAHFRIRDFATKRLDITVTGGSLLVSNCKIGDLSAIAELRGELSIDNNSKIDRADITVGERGRLSVVENVFKSFQVAVDSTGSAYLPKELIAPTKSPVAEKKIL